MVAEQRDVGDLLCVAEAVVSVTWERMSALLAAATLVSFAYLYKSLLVKCNPGSSHSVIPN